MSIKRFFAVLAVCLTLVGCAGMTASEKGAAQGAVMGAGAGAIVGGIAVPGFGAVPGAAIGAVGGAILGSTTGAETVPDSEYRVAE